MQHVKSNASKMKLAEGNSSNVMICILGASGMRDANVIARLEANTHHSELSNAQRIASSIAAQFFGYRSMSATGLFV